MPIYTPRLQSIALAGLMALIADTALQAEAPEKLPLGNNTAPPYTVVEGSVKRLGDGYFEAYSRWINRSVIWAEEFLPSDSWDLMRGGDWVLKPWGQWVNAVPGRRLVLSVPMLVGPWKGDGPKTGSGAGEPVSLGQGAAGAYNAHFEALAQNLVKNGLGNTILRLGWEFNGGWYTWRAGKNPGAFAAYWREIVKTMRAVPGAEKLQFCWNPTVGLRGSKAFDAWPGDEYVDFVGVDVYDQAWISEIYPLPEDATVEDIQSRREKSWKEHLLSDLPGRDGLAFWAKFAREHGNKPLAICEWGLVYGKHGGRDNPYFVEQMHEFIINPENNVYFHCYFDVNAPDGDHMLFPWPEGKGSTKMPEAAKRYRELFGLPRNGD